MAEKNKTRFDQRVTPSALDIGDRVLVKNVRIRGKHKLADKWESTVHVVVKRADLPVYTVKPETGEGPWRTLHRDLLLPCGFLPATTEVCVQPKPADRCKTRQSTGSGTWDADLPLDYLSLDEDESAHVTWSTFKPVPEEARCIFPRDVPSLRDLSHFENNLTTNLNKVTDGVPASADSLPDVTPVNHETQNLDLPKNDNSEKKDLPEDETVETETDLPDNDSLTKNILGDDCPEQFLVLSNTPLCEQTNIPKYERKEETEETE